MKIETIKRLRSPCVLVATFAGASIYPIYNLFTHVESYG
jgi:hypothetical protein